MTHLRRTPDPASPPRTDGDRALRPWFALGAGALALLVYTLTLAPSLTWAHWGADGGDFVTAAATGRVPHPPGFPLYLLLSRAVVALGPGDPARALNALSAAMAAGAVVWVALAGQRWGLSPWVAALTALTLGLAPWFWSQALITEVYATAAFFTALALYLGDPARVGHPRAALAAGWALGAAAAAHPLAGVAALYLLPIGQGPRRRLAFLAGVGVGLLPYALLPLFGPWPQPWGDLRTLLGWWQFVTARIYWGNAFALPSAAWPGRLLAWLVLLIRQFSPLGAVGLVLGSVFGRGRAPGRWARALLTFGVGSVYAMGYNTGDSWVYLVPLLPLPALVMGLGLQWSVDRGLPALLAAAVPLVLLVNWSQMDLHADREVARWLDRALAPLPADALAVTAADAHTFALWYATDALGRRPDVTVVDRRLWGDPAYVAYLARRRDGATAAAHWTEWAGGAPVCVIGAEGAECR